MTVFKMVVVGQGTSTQSLLFCHSDEGGIFAANPIIGMHRPQDSSFVGMTKGLDGSVAAWMITGNIPARTSGQAS
jgi:hypothetical protein